MLKPRRTLLTAALAIAAANAFPSSSARRLVQKPGEVMEDTAKRIAEKFAQFEAQEDPAPIEEAFEIAVEAQRSMPPGDATARGRIVALWLRFFAALDRNIDNRFDPKLLPTKNAPLPREHGIVFPSGEVDPKSIPDPVERERYERATKATKVYARHYYAQTILRRVEQRAIGMVGRLLADNCAEALDRQELEMLLAESPASDARKQQFRALMPRRRRARFPPQAS